MSFLRDFDAYEITRAADSDSSRRIKREWIKRGYEHQISFYGVLTDSETDESSFRRIEILSNIPYNFKIAFLLYNYFYEFKVIAAYTLWIYDRDRDKILLVGKYA